MTRLTGVEPEETEGPVCWHHPMIWTADIERSPCWWPSQELLEVITPGRRIYYRRDELEDVRFL
ncbi:MAG TPA: hypothetical protein VFU47_11135 [Armatimonadota bacterium]|nr:hypothetical protein [Armatimonadota bacterium]